VVFDDISIDMPPQEIILKFLRGEQLIGRKDRSRKPKEEKVANKKEETPALLTTES
jgi:hypothetical protein